MTSRFFKPMVLCGFAVTACHLHAQAPADWPAFRGSNSGTAPVLPAAITSATQIKELWKVPTSNGFSSFVVSGASAYTIVSRDVQGNTHEVLIALDVKSGKEQWAAPLTMMRKYDGGGDSGAAGNGGGDGPRSTPCVSDGKVYAIDANVGVYCFDAKTGKSVWKHDVMKEYGGKNIKWQNAASPVIDGDVLLMAGGGAGKALLGFDKKTGNLKWKGEDDQMTHATPVIADILGVHQCIFFTQKGLVAVSPQDGKVLWRGDFPFKISTAASPVVFEDVVYCSAGYGVGAGAFKIAKSGSGLAATQIWRRENQCFNHWSTPVVKDGYLYGMFSFKEYGAGPVACVDIRTGEDKWKQAGFGPGQVILSGDTVIALSDKGEIVFIKADPAAYTELKRESLVKGKVWSYPVLAFNHLFARSTVEGGCWEVK